MLLELVLGEDRTIMFNQNVSRKIDIVVCCQLFGCLQAFVICKICFVICKMCRSKDPLAGSWKRT